MSIALLGEAPLDICRYCKHLIIEHEITELRVQSGALIRTMNSCSALGFESGIPKCNCQIHPIGLR